MVIANGQHGIKGARRAILFRFCGADLFQMMDQVPEVVARQKGKGDRLSRADATDGLQLGVR